MIIYDNFVFLQMMIEQEIISSDDEKFIREFKLQASMNLLYFITLSGVIHLLHLHYKHEMIKTFCEKEVIESNLRHIIDNLEEAIITKSKNGVGLCNKLGFMILNDIYHD